MWLLWIKWRVFKPKHAYPVTTIASVGRFTSCRGRQLLFSFNGGLGT